MVKRKIKAYTHMNDAEFNNIKKLKEVSLSVADAAQVTGRTKTTISRVYSCDTFDDYKALMNGLYIKKKSRPGASMDAIAEAINQARKNNSVIVTSIKDYKKEQVLSLVDQAAKEGVIVMFTPQQA